MSVVPRDPMPIPRPEYPRPDMDRSPHWIPLNGRWDFEAAGRHMKIAVPFAWETRESGVAVAWLENAVYRRTFRIPPQWKGRRTVLCFGAVHHSCEVRVDGVLVGEHTGGYDSFEIDIADHVRIGESHELRVDVHAPIDKRSIVHGKQRSIPRDDYDGVSFTPTSGIWQSVWLEGRGNPYLHEIRLSGEDLESIGIRARVSAPDAAGLPVLARIVETGEQTTMMTDGDGMITGNILIAEPRLWSPEDPHLYHVVLTMGRGDGMDEVTVTTGLRRIQREGRRILLNGRQIFLRGVLDQGYWSDSGLTAPSLDHLCEDLEKARELGFTMVRKHLKFEDPLWLHEADRMGMLVWAEPACPSRFSDQAAAAFESQIPSMVVRDGNHPSIIIWGLYNEEWGLDWDISGSEARAEAVRRAYQILHEIDSSRLIVENSGWSHVCTDLVDWHYYEPDLRTWKDRLPSIVTGAEGAFPVRLAPDFVVDKRVIAPGHDELAERPNVNSEYGEGWTSLERAWQLRWETQELRRHDDLSGYVYTELCDVEHEAAGLLDARRCDKDWGGCIPADVHADTVVIVDLVPKAAGADIEPPLNGRVVDVRVSHHGTEAIRGRIWCSWVRQCGTFDEVDERQEVTETLEVQPFRVSSAHPVLIPARDCAGRLFLWFEDEDGIVRARSFIDAAEVEPVNRRGARPGEFVGVPFPGRP